MAAPHPRDSRLHVAWAVIDEKQVGWLEAAPQFYGFEKALRWLGDAKGCSVMNGNEMAFKAQFTYVGVPLAYRHGEVKATPDTDNALGQCRDDNGQVIVLEHRDAEDERVGSNATVAGSELGTPVVRR